MKPETCIIVLSHNACNVTKDFLTKLYENTCNFHLIMIDNGSTDETVSYLPKFEKEQKNMTLIMNKENLGVIGGRNFGYQKFCEINAKREKTIDYLMFLDNDQYVLPGWLEHHYNVMEESHADIVGVEGWLLSAALFPSKKCKNISEPFSYVGCGGMLMKSIVPKTLGGMFDEQFNPCYFEDPDFCARARKSGFQMAWNSKAKLIHLGHQTLGVNPKKAQLFRQSHDKFRKKWNNRIMKPIYQSPVPSLISVEK